MRRKVLVPVVTMLMVALSATPAFAAGAGGVASGGEFAVGPAASAEE